MTLIHQGLYNKPDKSSNVSKKPSNLKFSGNTNYSIKKSSGINPQKDTWSVTFKDTPYSISIIEQFLSDTEGTTPFRWKPTESPSRVWMCEEWSVSYDGPDVHTLTATFVECHDTVGQLAARTLDGSWILDGNSTLDYLQE